MPTTLSPRPGRAKNLRFINHFNKSYPIGAKIIIDIDGTDTILTVASTAKMVADEVLCVFSEFSNAIPIKPEKIRPK